MATIKIIHSTRPTQKEVIKVAAPSDARQYIGRGEAVYFKDDECPRIRGDVQTGIAQYRGTEDGYTVLNEYSLYHWGKESQ